MIDVRELLSSAKRRNPEAFDYSEFQPVVMSDYRRAIAAGLVVGDPATAGLHPIAADKSGGYYLTWADNPSTSCVVYLGSEGQQYVAAASQEELASMLPYGGSLCDAMAYCSHKLTEQRSAEDLAIHRERLATELSAAALDAARTSGDPASAWINSMVAAADSAGIRVERDPLARIEAVNVHILRDWLEVCERRFEIQLVAQDPQRIARVYRASEAFQIGEWISHPTFGEGIVHSRPEPGKMTVFFKSGRKVLAQPKEPGPAESVIPRRR
jgi:hypothetical protein